VFGQEAKRNEQRHILEREREREREKESEREKKKHNVSPSCPRWHGKKSSTTTVCT
jgi:hypothetical protein